MAKKKLSARSERRERERDLRKLIEKREALARLSEGGAPERPIAVESASQVEVHARSLPCLGCDEVAHVRVEEHAATEQSGTRLRVVRTRCARCGRRRESFFRIAGPVLN